ncbi:MAG: peptidylprolyl isomerase [Cyanobacteria bacterium J06621_8]
MHSTKTKPQAEPKIDPVAKIIHHLGKYNLLSQIQQEVMIDDAISSIRCTAEELKTAYQEIFKTTENDQESKLATLCQQSEQAKQQVYASIIRKLKIEKFKQATWGAEISSYFISQKKKLDKVVYSEIVHPDEGVATEIYFRLLGKEQSFSELALEYLQNNKPQSYQPYEPIKLCTLDSQIGQLLIKHEPGHVLRPIHCGKSYRVLRFEKIIPAVLDHALHCQLLDELFQAWLDQGCNKPNYRQLLVHQLSSWTT